MSTKNMSSSTKNMSTKYLCIKNQGVAPLETLTTLGLSTSDGSINGVIGQFGTGMKHGVNLLIRNNLSPTVCLGTSVVTFGSVSKTIHTPNGMTIYDQATIVVDGVEKELGYTLSFGHHDWDDVCMALREFISNAIDMTIKLHGTYLDPSLCVSVVSDIEPSDGVTCVYVPMNDAIRKYIRSLDQYFLHFSGESFDYGTMERGDVAPCRVYREGVFVRELDDKSIFDYNFQASKIKIDESRNLDNYRACGIVQEYLEDGISVDDACVVLEAIKSNVATLEGYRLGCSWTLERPSTTWTAAVGRVFGPKDILCHKSSTIVVRLITEGYNPVIVENSLMSVLKAQGMKCLDDVLSYSEREGYTIVESDEYDHVVENEIWASMAVLEACGGQAKPDVQYFVEATDDQNVRRLGFVRDNIVYINDCLRGESTKLRAVIIEEYVHFLSDCADCTRGFQTFCCEMLANAFLMMED